MGPSFDLIGDGFSLGKLFNQTVPEEDPPVCFLFDNGSLRAASTLNLRKLAGRLEGRLNTPVHPVSLLHSSGVDTAELEGVPAELLEPAVNAFARRGGRGAILLPLFFGPSAALLEYVPDRMADLRQKWPMLNLCLAECLVRLNDESGEVIARILAKRVNEIIENNALSRPRIVLTDHGSPQPAVAAVRNHVADQLRRQLDGAASTVTAASMERRPGAAFAFSDPLLETVLQDASSIVASATIVALQFLQAGRHAGPGGDIDRICADSRYHACGGKLFTTQPIGDADELVDLLARRYAEAREPKTRVESEPVAQE